MDFDEVDQMVRQTLEKATNPRLAPAWMLMLIIILVLHAFGIITIEIHRGPLSSIQEFIHDTSDVLVALATLFGSIAGVRFAISKWNG